jgi:hypothetical protein
MPFVKVQKNDAYFSCVPFCVEMKRREGKVELELKRGNGRRM